MRSKERLSMNKGMKTFLIVWTIVIVAYDAIMAISKSNLMIDNDKFLTSMITSNIAFVIMLVCGLIVSKNLEIKKIFNALPIITYAYTALCIILTLNIAIMLDDRIPNYFSIIISIIVLATMLINVVLLKEGTSYIASVDSKVEEKLKFSNELLQLIKKLQNITGGTELKEDIDSLYELVRYSNFRDKNETEETIILKQMNDMIEKCQDGNANKDSIKEVIKEIRNKIRTLMQY